MADHDRRRLARHRIGRSALRDIRPFIAAIVATVPILLLGLPLLLEALGAEETTATVAGGVTFVLVLVALLVFLNLPGTATIGDDGVLVDTRNRRRFVPWSRVARVERHEVHVGGKRIVGVALVLHDGEDVVVPIGEAHLGGAERVEVLLADLRGALARSREDHAAPADFAERLAPGKASTAEWASRLRRVGAGTAEGHRIATVSGERLWRIVEDPSQDTITRAGAGFALRASTDATGRARLRALAEGTADPSLQATLASLAEEEEAAAVEALDALRGPTGWGAAAGDDRAGPGARSKGRRS